MKKLLAIFATAVICVSVIATGACAGVEPSPFIPAPVWQFIFRLFGG